MARYQVNHRTIYRYEQPVAVSHHAAHLQPRKTRWQQPAHFHLTVDPPPSDLLERTDYFGNAVQQFSIQQWHDTLVVDCESEVTVAPPEIPFADLVPTCGEVRRWLDRPRPGQMIDALQFRFPSPVVPWDPAAAAFGAQFLGDDVNFFEGACALAAYIHDNFAFDPAATDVSTPVSEVIRLQRGVCQDFAHVMIAALRAQQLPARYISGYILTHPPEGQERLQGADASHAWVSIYLPNFGWLDLDPTNRQLITEEHVTVAFGRDYTDVAPLLGAVTGGGTHTLAIEVTMTPFDPPEAARQFLPTPQMGGAAPRPEAPSVSAPSEGSSADLLPPAPSVIAGEIERHAFPKADQETGPEPTL